MNRRQAPQRRRRHRACTGSADVRAVHDSQRETAVGVGEDYGGLDTGLFHVQGIRFRSVGGPLEAAYIHVTAHIGGKGIAGVVLSVGLETKGGFLDDDGLLCVKKAERLFHDLYCLFHSADAGPGHICSG